MVGDGCKWRFGAEKADLGVAMYAGAPASRRVADIILLNNSFTSLPMGMKLGNQIMQAIEVIAVLFFHKIILRRDTSSCDDSYWHELSVFAAPHYIYEYFLVTMPTLMWTLFPPTPKHRTNPKRFWHDTLLAVTPIALITGVTVAFTYWLPLLCSLVTPRKSQRWPYLPRLVWRIFGVLGGNYAGCSYR